MSDTRNAIDLKFSAMPVGYLKRWQNWAQNHDWCSHCGYDVAGNLFVCGYDDRGERASFTFATPRELRDWAGY